MHQGTGPGLSPRPMGQRTGSETNTLTTGQLPQHNHILAVSSANGTVATPASGGTISKSVENQGRSVNEIDSFNAATPDVVLNTASVGNTGNNQSVNNMPPFLVVNWCIALQGIFPSRN